jgi:hypothetical protein
VKRPNLADWAGYGYCASHSRFFWGLRLHLICTPSGLTVGRLGASQPEDRERQVLMAVREHEPMLLAQRPGLLIAADKGCVSGELGGFLTKCGVRAAAARRIATAPRIRLSTCSNRSVS